MKRRRVHRVERVQERLTMLANRRRVPLVVERFPVAWEELGDATERLQRIWNDKGDTAFHAYVVRQRLGKLILLHELLEEEYELYKALVAGLPIRTYWRPTPSKRSRISEPSSLNINADGWGKVIVAAGEK